MNITLNINGQDCEIVCQPGDSLLRVLRREGLYSVRYGSDDGRTGASAILVDGRLMNADVMLAAQAEGHKLETLEGLAPSVHEMHPIQDAFVRTGAIQCGYCTPAMILATKELLEKKVHPTEQDARDALSGVLCRCTGYVKPVQAVLEAAAVMRGEAPNDIRVNVVPPMIYERHEKGLPLTEADLSDARYLGIAQWVDAPEPLETRVVGKPEDKVDAYKLAKGNAAFVDDIEMRGLLYAKLLTSPHAHANILSIDDRDARALPGVHAVMHCFNVERVKYASGGQSYPNPKPYDQVSFDTKVRYVGDRVAAVAAESLEIAEEALKLIKVEYEVLPAVFDARDAMQSGAPVIHDEEDTTDIHDRERNISHHIEAEVGDVEDAFKNADFVYSADYEVHQVQQVPIEPHIAISWWDEDGRLVIRTSTQVPFHTRRMVAPLLGLPVKQIRVIKPRIGGGFGVKQEMLIEDIVGHLTIATGRPVRLELDRREEFVSSRTRHPQYITFKSGVDSDGKLVALEMTVIGNTGAYATHGLTVQTVTGLRGLSTYNCHNMRFECHVVYTNIPVPGAYRGYGGPQALFALESHMDEVAHKLGMDVIEFRQKNYVQVGDPLPIAPLLGEGEADNVSSVPVILSSALDECIAQGKKLIGWERRLDPNWRFDPDRPYVRRGLGMAVCMHGTAIPGLDMGSASIKMNDDGSFNLLFGATDLGTGADTVLAQIAAEVLGVPTEDVIVYAADTDLTPFDTGAYASSTTYISGMAVMKAAEGVCRQIKDRAGLMLESDAQEDMDLRDRAVHLSDGRAVSLQEIALHSLHQDQQRQIMDVASYVSMESPPPFAAQFAEIEVDMQTGQVTVKKLVMSVDGGCIINPITASGQIEGGMAQALGYGHCEEMRYSLDGNMLNADLAGYRIYAGDEMPEMIVSLVQSVEPSGPYGVKAVAEIPKDGVAPALVNALYDATGSRMRSIPLVPSDVFQQLG